MGEEFIRVSVAARRLDITAQHFIRLVRAGRLPFELKARKRIWALKPLLFVNRADVEKYAAAEERIRSTGNDKATGAT